MKPISKLVTYIKINFTCTSEACFDLIFQLLKICYGHFHISSFMSIAVNAFCHTLIPYSHLNPLIITCKLMLCYVNTNLYSTLGGTRSSYQLRFTIAAAKANHHSVSHHYEREPPSPRSTPWGAYRSASHFVQYT